jgi:CHAT domain-containing protein
MMRRLLAAFLAAALFSGSFSSAPPAYGQERLTPTARYYAAFIPFYDGDYASALRAFQEELRGSIKTSQSRWIDSICYDTMCGECYYQMGVFDQALLHYTNALHLFQRFPDWMMKVRFEQSIAVAATGARKIVPWGASSRQTKLGHYRTTELLAQGQIDMTDTIRRGGVVQQANLFRVTPQEIVRCTTLALRRRAELLGPVAKYDPVSNDIATTFGRPIGLPNHWSSAWVDLEHGLAIAGSSRDQQAIAYLRRAELAGGEFDHPMTSVALLELGREALRHNDYPAATKLFDEATYSAVNYPDYGVLEEAFRYGALTHLLANRKGLYPPLEPAAQWAKAKGLRQLRASLLLCLAENYAVLGETRQAATLLGEARATIHNRKMGAGRIGARLNYLAALVEFQQKRIPPGNEALAAAMSFMGPRRDGRPGGSLWLFQIGLADGLYRSGTATPRTALDLFGNLLRDPLPADWALDPMESLAVLVTPQPAAMEHWFEATMERQGIKEIQTAIDVSERTRRRRFFNSLEFGGRLESLRWILEAPPASLPPQATLQRQDLLVRYPDYDRLSRQAQSIREALSKLPLVADDAAAAKNQMQQLADLATIGVQQEVILREIAVRREPADMVFPPLRSLADVQKSLPAKHAVLAFFANGRRLYGFLLDNERCKSWQVASPATLLRQMQAMLRDMGQYGQNSELAVKDLTEVKWQQSAQQVLTSMLKDSPADFSQTFDELVVVPDGALWYLPFEALQVVVEGQPQSLISRFKIRYAPTLSLCTPRGPARNAAGNTAVVVGRLYPGDAPAVAQAAFDQLSGVVPGAVAIHPPPPAPSSVYSTLFQRLIVLDDLANSEQDPYGWAVAPIDRGKAGATLSDWLALPWGGPDVVILPGFHTAAENGLKNFNRKAPGSEIFLGVCGLMANGSRTLLLSRWRSGGQTSFDLVREFAQELPDASASEAWKRAVLLTMDSRLNIGAEPRIKRTPADETPKANHAFFWAGYMLVDTGTGPEKAPPEAEGPVIKVKPRAKSADKEKPKDDTKDKLKSLAKENPKPEAKDKPADEPKPDVTKEPKKSPKAKSQIESRDKPKE